MPKKLPIGIQSIERIIEGGYLYVDKTFFAQKLIEGGLSYFMARPRRFGKSLFVSTLEAILSGNKELFEGCYIYDSKYTWNKHPVLRFDFTDIPATSTRDLEASLQDTLIDFSEAYAIPLRGSTLAKQFTNLIKAISQEHGKVTILVDEYDIPIIDNFSNLEVADKNREIIKVFFRALKSVDKHLGFTFITGVGKFAHTSLFSGFNNLVDITISPEYASMMGYTEEEIDKHFSTHIQEIVNKQEKQGVTTSASQVSDTIREWYNGYKFSHKGESVYNPHSTLSFLADGSIQSFWFATGTPSFLVDQVRTTPVEIAGFSPATENADTLMSINNLRQMSLKALMWQTGYLTIQDYDETRMQYILDFPNREVRTAFFRSLLEEFGGGKLSNVSSQYTACLTMLNNMQFQAFIKRMNSLYARVPFNLYDKACEGYFHALFLSFLEGMGIRTRGEERTNNGQIDLVVELPNVIYIFEFKLDQTSEIAINQIKAKCYQEKYLPYQKQLVLFGINFDQELRKISEWKTEAFSKECKRINDQ